MIIPIQNSDVENRRKISGTSTTLTSSYFLGKLSDLDQKPILSMMNSKIELVFLYDFRCFWWFNALTFAKMGRVMSWGTSFDAVSCHLSNAHPHIIVWPQERFLLDIKVTSRFTAFQDKFSRRNFYQFGEKSKIFDNQVSKFSKVCVQ